MHYCCIICCLFTISGSAFPGSDAPALDIISLANRAAKTAGSNTSINKLYITAPQLAARLPPPSGRRRGAPFAPPTTHLALRLAPLRYYDHLLQASFFTRSAPSGAFSPPSGMHLSSTAPVGAPPRAPAVQHATHPFVHPNNRVYSRAPYNTHTHSAGCMPRDTRAPSGATPLPASHCSARPTCPGPSLRLVGWPHL
ncbi:hypothetical protein HYPSUDRAFT_204592 [Hypholoma sublateritium FD-334 SS-4]|uniref:Uncharacterized protein n=1 Tax=Hypholoma sublateritium (strain FD-334 SS-4) TaxID=945553 RepID=A0A0D2NRP2_HYPSF|nr:hypothetical protein HYPSUDRAFT_204592 [Hypholoma sublateritium FD-334 SS-4]